MKIDKELLIDMYVNQGKTQQEIGEYFGCDRKNISYHLKKIGIKTRSQSETKKLNSKINITIQDIIERIEKGKLISEICEEFKVSRKVIYKITSENGYNFKNHKNQTIKQSEFMKENNPIKKGKKRNYNDVLKAIKTKNSKYINHIRNIDINSISKKDYSIIARRIAYREFKKEVPKGYQIDHKYSVSDGYENKVPLLVISDKSNLRIITKEENNLKGKKSIISIEELYEKSGVQRLSVKE